MFASVVQGTNFSTSHPDSANNTAGQSNNQYVSYVADPDGRGTASLVLSCLLTLILCVWSAVHPNVPSQERRGSVKSTILFNIRWVLAGIYAPELVVFVAWRQWCSARMLQKYIDQLPNPSAKTASRSGDMARAGAHEPNWTMVHSFFACAGGFSIELDSLHEALPPPRRVADSTVDEAARPTRLTLTARGVLFLAEHGWLPAVYREEIDDKSKANDLAKATVIIQATWMLVQVIGRLAARLPVTLLEINTVAHVLCAFGMYVFWWNKPLLPTEPFVIRNEEMAPLVAFMYSSSEMSGRLSEKSIKSQTPVKTLLANLLQYSTTPELESLCIRTDTVGGGSDAPTPALEVPIMHTPLLASIQREFDDSGAAHGVKPAGVATAAAHTKSPQAACRIQPAPASCLRILQERKEKEQGTAFFERRPRVIFCSGTKLRSGLDERRWRLIEEALAAAPWLLSQRTLLSHKVPCKSSPSSSLSSPGTSTSCLHLKPEQLVTQHVPNWPSSDLLRNVDGLVVGVVLWLANLLYGAFHAAAWNEHFPSAAERQLWHASAAYIAACGGFWVALNSAVARWTRLNRFWERWMDGEKSWSETVALGAVVVLCGANFALARIYVVLEAFLSIRELPASAYQTPQWSDIFPHL